MRIVQGYSTRKERAAMGIHEGLVRYSAGIEDPEDLIADIGQALAQFDSA
jgi:cystathionine beta-lyase/cystathionine gamma-synthase